MQLLPKSMIGIVIRRDEVHRHGRFVTETSFNNVYGSQGMLTKPVNQFFLYMQAHFQFSQVCRNQN